MTELREFILSNMRDEKVVFLQSLDGEDYVLTAVPIEDFLDQPIDGVLYDLNRLEEVSLTHIDDPKWVNDFAMALVVRALAKEIENLKNRLLLAQAESAGLGAMMLELQQESIALRKILGSIDPGALLMAADELPDTAEPRAAHLRRIAKALVA